MHRWMRNLGILVSLWAALGSLSLLRDRQALNEDLIRLHVVGASDSREDQQIKLQVRDQILNTLGPDLQKLPDAKAAMAFLGENLPRIQAAAEEKLRSLQKQTSVRVSLQKETFPVRHYESFSLPSGVYESLRVIIGEGKGHNWWCVAYPSLCIPAASKTMYSVAADAGLSQPLVGAIRQERPYEIRFYLLDLLGRLQTALQKP